MKLHRGAPTIAWFGTVAAASLLGGLFALGVTALPASACNTTAANTSCSPDNLATSTSSTFVQRQTGTLVSCKTGVTVCFSASYVEEAYRDPSNTFCAGCIDLLIQLTDNTVPNSDTADPIARITIGNFGGIESDQGVDTNPPPSGSQITTSGTATPCLVDRENTGSVLAWEFQPPNQTSCLHEIAPGQTTVVLDVMTNGRNVIPGEISAEDESADSEPGLSVALPEAPLVAGFMLVGGGAAMLFLRRRPRRTRKQPPEVTEATPQ